MKELRKTITAIFRKFSMDPHNSPLKKQKDREIAGRFIDRVHSSEFDTSTLPYYSKDGLAKHSNKAECVFALMCDVVLVYWDAVKAVSINDGDAVIFTKTVSNKLKQLETVLKNYDQLKVLGDEKGYCLFESQRKDLYGKKEKQPAAEEADPEKTNKGADQPVDSKETQVGDVTEQCKECTKEPYELCGDCNGYKEPDDGDMSLGEEQALRGGGAL